MLEVGPSPRGGRGVFATEAIDADVLLMRAAILLVPAEQRAHLQTTVVDDYVYEWDGEGTAALVLGISSMCNHDPDPNAFLWLVTDDVTAELWSTRPIAVGEEITVSYRAEGEDTPLWFDVVTQG
jgi:uncharacterized protein